MNFKLRINNYINLSNKWLTKFVLVWCSISLLVGVYAVNDLALAIAAPLMTIFMYFSGMVMLMFVIGFQQVSLSNSPKSKLVDCAIILFWCFGIFGFINFLIFGIFDTSEFENSNFFFIVASVFPLGVSSGAAKQWEKARLMSRFI